MTHDKDLTKSMFKGLATTILVMPLIGIYSLKALFMFPITWLMFQGIYNLGGEEYDAQ